MALDPNRWTLKTQEALQSASRLATEANHAEVTPAHVLTAALGQEGGVALPILDRMGIAILEVRNRLASALERLPRAYGGATPQMSRELRDGLERAVGIEREMGDEYLSVEHLLVAFHDVLGVDRDALLKALREVRGSHKVTSQEPENAYQSLER